MTVQKEALDRKRLAAKGGDEYFKGNMWPFFVKGEQCVFLRGFLGPFKTWKGNPDFVTWIAKLEIVLQRVGHSWMDLLRKVHPEENNPDFAAALGQDANFNSLRPKQAVYASNAFGLWNQEKEDRHRRSFPFKDNLLSILFLVQSNLNEQQCERWVSSLTSQAYRIETFSYLAVCQTMLDQFATTRTSLQDPNTRHSSHKKDRQGREITAVGGQAVSSSLSP